MAIPELSVIRPAWNVPQACREARGLQRPRGRDRKRKRAVRGPTWRPPGPRGPRLQILWPRRCWASCGLRPSPRAPGGWLPPPRPAPRRRRIPCLPAPNIMCKDSSGNETHFTGKEVGFYKPIPCRNVNGYSYKVAVALSLFLGWLGADRFYLGYPALGLLKFCTVGFCGIGSLIDFILISMQIVGPSDGSSYIIDYYGTRLIRLSITNETFRKTQLYP
ncbi:TM2 domain-containing protein 1 [Octodon degus]|uniref:TM2 domain-containing protein 1 n=1 Tax=Octodon degus TaxID=10160 RepID=A0A6P6EPX0_OCTDE|nr:TM2 domain-containing protein 1 [Octodon degus]